MAGTFTKHGLTFEDHHFKDAEGQYQSSPPKNLKTLYEYLPTERDATSKQTPQKLVFKSAVNALKVQGHCCGVYTLVTGKMHNDRPTWKHSTEDLMIVLGKGAGEDFWVVVHSKTLSTKERWCMKAPVSGSDKSFPFDGTHGKWQEWTGRVWELSSTATCRPSHHGWGADGGDGYQFHQESSFHDHQFAVHKGNSH